MFRELRRKNKQISKEECVTLLKRETRGVLSVIGDGDYPYGMPMNHFYNENDGKIYFHSGRAGHREDALRRNNKASFCLFEQGVRKAGDWALTVRSVVVFGKIEIIDDPATVADITERLCHKFTDNEAYIKAEIAQHAHNTVLLCLAPEHICGKLVVES